MPPGGTRAFGMGPTLDESRGGGLLRFERRCAVPDRDPGGGDREQERVHLAVANRGGVVIADAKDA